MNKRFQLGCILGLGLCSGLYADTTGYEPFVSKTRCDQQIDMRDVLVLDLEPMRHQPEAAQEFVFEYAGDFRLLSSKPDEFYTRYRPSKDPDGVIRGARRAGARNGCDLVLVLKTGNYFGRQRGRRARVKDRGYALFVMGQRAAN